MALASYAIITMSEKTYTIDLRAWGESFKTDLIELDPGTYQVTSVQLYDADDHSLYATPTAGSEFGAFVNQPLPFEVTVENYRKIEYDLEVLCIEEFTPPQFGFVFWDVTIKEVKNLCVFTNYCEPDTGHEVASLEAFIYPNANSTSPEDLIWSGSADGDFESENESNELLCLKFPYDPSIPAENQSYFIELYVNGVLFEGTMPLDRVDEINADKGYLHLNENCDGDFDVFSNSYIIAWEALRGDDEENDADFNDLILQTTTFTDINTGDLNFVFEPLARSAGSELAFKLWLPETGYVVSGDAASVDTSSGDTEITVYENTRQAAFGTSTDADIAEFLKQKMASFGVKDGWSPDQNPNVNSGVDRGHSHATEKVIMPGDVIQIDFGIKVYDRWVTDIQRFAYVLKEGETEAPEDIAHYWESSKAGSRAALAAMKPGVKGVDADRAQRILMEEAGSEYVMWSTGHPVGYVAHDVGPNLGGSKSSHVRPASQKELKEGMTFAFDGFHSWKLKDGGLKTMSVEEMAVVLEDGAVYLIPPQEDLILIGKN